jgi:TatD DNase family protein
MPPSDLIDVHAHLGDACFDDDREEVLERARAAEVVAIVAVGETLADAETNLALAGRHGELVRPTAGLHPTVLDLDQAREIASWIRLHRSRLAAIGEVGLDHWKVQDERERAVQHEIFLLFVKLATELDLPLNVHSRSAGRHTIGVLLEAGARRVLMHAFDGRAASALPGVEAGYLFSVPPSVVRSPQKQKLVRRLPLECDSPVLGAHPDARNEPANVRISLRAVAELKGVREEEVAVATTENARRLFGW